MHPHFLLFFCYLGRFENAQLFTLLLKYINKMNTNRYKIQPPRINNIPITGYKRDYNDFNGSSDTPSTSSITSPISKPDIDSAHKNIKTNSFASHLPPLYKKQKSISSIN
eukprot:326300_1